MSINVNDKNIGHATAYAYYKAGGGTMTKAEFTEFMADFGTASQTAVEAAQAALASKNAAQTAATTATTKASEATTAAQTATTKAGEASTSASTATSAKDTAVSASQTATTKASEATTAAATATSAASTATTAKDDAVSAKTAAQTAQTGAETAAASVQSSASQIAQNTSDISELKEDLNHIITKEDVSSPNLLNFDDADFLTGKYINPPNGVLYSSSIYNTSGYIPVESGKTYTYTYGSGFLSRQMRFICAFDANKNVVSSAGAENRNSYTVPEGVAFIRFSAESAYFYDKPWMQSQTPCMFYEGTSIDQYYPYFEPYTTYTVKNEALDAGYLNGLINAKIVDVVTDYGLYVTAKADSMTSADTLTAVQNIDNKKNDVIGFYAEFDSFSSVIVGHGFDINYGNKAVIDDTYLTVYYGSAQQQISHVAHGLTISDFIRVTITQNNGARAKIHIVTASGDYTLSDCSWDGCRGDVFAKTGGNLTGCVLTAVFKDFNEKLFLFGDSYVSMGDPSRYPYYLVQQGYTHLLIDGWGGRNSAQAIVSFDNVITKAIPKYAVWALGMNDVDSASAANASWLSCVQSFLATCEEKGITPILATIPNCPNQLNTFKNTWVRESGHRYVDFAKAVGAETQGATWYTGMLSSDETHPTALGAKALYARLLTDVPEVIR